MAVVGKHLASKNRQKQQQNKFLQKEGITTNQRIKKLKHIVLAKTGGAYKLWPTAWQSRKSLRGRRNSTPSSVGGLLLLFIPFAIWNPADKRLFSVALTDGRTEPQSQSGAQRQTGLCKECAAGSVSEWTAALLPVAAPLILTTTAPAHAPQGLPSDLLWTFTLNKKTKYRQYTEWLSSPDMTILPDSSARTTWSGSYCWSLSIHTLTSCFWQYLFIFSQAWM